MRLTNPQNNIITNPARKFSVFYGCGELVWYLNEQASMEQIIHYAPSYAKFADDSYAFYGRRLALVGGNQLIRIMNELRANPSSRRCVAQFWIPKDLAMQERKDLPCTISWKFNVCNGQLNMIADMRSNDAWLGMPNDIFVNTCVHVLMCMLTGYDIGFYQHQVADMHLYNRDYAKAMTAINVHRPEYYDSTPMGIAATWDDVHALVEYEKRMREQHLSVLPKPCPFFNFVLENLDDNRRGN